MAVTFSGKDHLLKDLRLYAGGYNLSGDALNISTLDNQEQETDMAGWSDAMHYYTITGRKNIGMSGLQVFMNPDTTGAFGRLKDSPVQALMAFLMGGAGEPVIGDPAFLLPALTLADVISFDSDRAVLSTDGRLHAAYYDAYVANPLGYVLMDGAAQSATWNANSVDYAAAQVALTSGVGSQAILFVLNASATTWTFKVQHSTDDAAWADLHTFVANGSAITAERISSSTLVNRYVRFQGTKGAPAGTTQAVCVFSRIQRP